MKWALFGFALLFVSGCASVSSFQTARTLEKGKTRFVIAGGYTEDTSFRDAAGDTIQFPMIEGGGRFGLMEHMDVGAKISLPGTISGDFKYQVLDGDYLAGAVGIGLSYLGLSGKSTSTNATINTTLLDILVPLYFSFDVSSWLGFYASPRFVYRVVFGSTTTGIATSGNGEYLGIAGGVRIGDKSGLMTEVAYLDDLGSGAHVFMFGVALFFGQSASVPVKSEEEPTDLGKEARLIW